MAPAEVLALLGNGVEDRGRTHVHHYGGAAVQVEGGRRVGYAVGPDVAGIVV